MTFSIPTEAQIHAIRLEALEAGDTAMAAICDEASSGDEAALRNVATVLADAAAQVSS